MNFFLQWCLLLGAVCDCIYVESSYHSLPSISTLRLTKFSNRVTSAADLAVR